MWGRGFKLQAGLFGEIWMVYPLTYYVIQYMDRYVVPIAPAILLPAGFAICAWPPKRKLVEAGGGANFQRVLKTGNLLILRFRPLCELRGLRVRWHRFAGCCEEHLPWRTMAPSFFLSRSCRVAGIDSPCAPKQG